MHRRDPLGALTYDGSDLESAGELWSKIADGQVADGDFEELLLSLWKKWRADTLAAELARALLAEVESAERDPEAESLRLAEFETWRKTERIDGVLPLRIPAPMDLLRLGDELQEEAMRLRLGKSLSDRAREELALAHLALLHRRPLISSHRLPIALYAACPQSATSRARDTLMLLGKLPLGGTITACFSSLVADERCVFAPGALEHLDRLQLRRAASGKLMLAAGPKRSGKPKENWTFRL